MTAGASPPQRRPNRVLGGPHDTFWAYCDAGELRLQRCDECQGITWPPRTCCEHCESQSLQWERMSGSGKVISWCIFERRYYEQLPVPWHTILVELEEGPLFISNPHGFEDRDMRWEMPVRVVFVDCEDDAGPFRLPVFTRP